jgi:hypothetical protein
MRPLAQNDPRVGRAIASIAALFPEEDFRYRFGANATLRRVEDPAEEILRQLFEDDPRTCAFTVNHRSNPFIALYWSRRAAYLPGLEPDKVSFDFRGAMTYADRCEKVLVALANTTEPWMGCAQTREADECFEGQRQSDRCPPHATPFGLPILYTDHWRYTRFTPKAVHWMNVWSRGTLHEIGYRPEDARLFHDVRRLDNDALMVRLTDEPIDPLRHPEHIEALRVVYERFPKIGGRDPSIPRPPSQPPPFARGAWGAGTPRTPLPSLK